jgi:hypothetical protein
MYHQQTQYILVDEHDHWPTAAELATLPEAALLGLAQRYVGSTAAGGSWLGGGQLGSWLGG